MATNPPPPETHGGVIREVRQFVSVFAQYTSARLRLARLEGKEAAAHLLKVVVLAAATIAFAVFAWLFVCVAVISLIAEAFSSKGWIWASLIMAGAHVVLVIIFTAVLKHLSRNPVFPLTTEELKKDQQWLESPTQTKPN